MGTRQSRASNDSDRPPTAASEGGPTATQNQKQDIFYSRKHLADPDAPPLPVGFAMGKMAPDALRWLRRCEIFAAPESHLPTLGFTKCIDYPHLPGHVYYEGYFHALHGEDGGDRHIASMNPRTGCNMQKPAAPRELRAFIEGMRRANTPRLVKALSDVAKAEPGNRLVVKVMRLIEEGRVFADLAVQIHAGQAVERADIGWHTDGPNSILHAALSIAGARALHSRRHADADPSTMEGEFVEPMSPGDVYVSSPAAFAHGVSYGQAYRWSKRTIAVQARFLFDGATEAYGFVEPDEMGDWAGLMRALSSSLAGSPLELPDMSTVLGVMAELERKEGAAIQPPPVTTHAGSTPAAALRKKPAVVTSSS